MKATTTYAERIKIIIENEHLNPTSFSKIAGFTNNVTILKILEENRKPIKSTLDRITKAFPQYNYRWLLTGEGEMLTDNSQKNSNVNINNITTSNDNNYIEIIKQKDKVIEQMNKVIEEQQKIIEKLTK